MSVNSYWRGFIDAQGDKRDYRTEERLVTHRRRSILKPLAEILHSKVEEYRSGFLVRLPSDWEKRLGDKQDLDYLRGWFAARGRKSQRPTFRMMVSGKNVDQFIKIAHDLEPTLNLPAPNKPSTDSEMKRFIVTGDRARRLSDMLKKNKS